MDRTYRVIKTFNKSLKRIIIKEGLTIEQAKRLANSYPKRNTSTVVFAKEFRHRVMKTYIFTDTLTGERYYTKCIDSFKIHNYQNYDTDFCTWCTGRILTYIEEIRK